MENPALITAWATVAIALVMGLGAAATCFPIWRGLLEMPARRTNVQKIAVKRTMPTFAIMTRP